MYCKDFHSISWKGPSPVNLRVWPLDELVAEVQSSKSMLLFRWACRPRSAFALISALWFALLVCWWYAKIYLFICLFSYLSTSLSDCLSLSLLPLYLSVCLSLCLSVCVSSSLSVRLFVSPCRLVTDSMGVLFTKKAIRHCWKAKHSTSLGTDWSRLHLGELLWGTCW